jgi:hypothetical protein
MEAVEAVCLLALQVGRPSYRFVRKTLQHWQKRRVPPASGKGLGIMHENVRGPGFFSGEGQPC